MLTVDQCECSKGIKDTLELVRLAFIGCLTEKTSVPWRVRLDIADHKCIIFRFAFECDDRRYAAVDTGENLSWNDFQEGIVEGIVNIADRSIEHSLVRAKAMREAGTEVTQ